ncbi:MAG: DinB family protein [Acidobacteria bacterium]|nr:DinB family protein [Acidobacteriota bacterium]
MKRMFTIAALAVLVAVPVLAQTAAAPATPAAPAQAAAPVGPTDPLSRVLFGAYNSQKMNLTQSAEKVSEADYAFQPTKDVRTFAQMFAHVANTQFTYCAVAKGEPNPNKDDFEKTALTKAAIQKALADSFAYCDTVYLTLTDAKAMEMVKAGQNDVPRAARLISNIAHDNEHYGNLVTYMRIKGLVPPSTERAQQMRR